MVIAIIPCVAARDILRQLNSRCSPLSEASTAQIQRPYQGELEALSVALLDFQARSTSAPGWPPTAEDPDPRR